MSKAIVYFSDKSSIELEEGDRIIPISHFEDKDEISTSMGKSFELYDHPHNGLTPSILNAFANCDFFYLNHDYNVAYNSKAFVKIELI